MAERQDNDVEKMQAYYHDRSYNNVNFFEKKNNNFDHFPSLPK